MIKGKLKEIIKIHTVDNHETQERIEFFLEWIYKNQKAIHRKAERLSIEISQLLDQIQKKAKKIHYDPMGSTDLFVSIAVSQKTIIETNHLEAKNGQLKGLLTKRDFYRNECKSLDQKWVKLMKLLNRL